MEKLGKKLKHDHTLTSILKFTIFAMVMLAPIFSVASRCLYVICNKNAKDSYSEYLSESKLVSINGTSEIVQNGTYYINVKNMLTINESYHTSAFFINSYKDVTLDLITFFNISTSQAESITKLQFQTNITNGFLFQIWNNNTQIAVVNNNNKNVPNFYAIGTIDNSTPASYFNNHAYYVEIIGKTTLDNAFEYSLSQLQESSYYNWATNLGIYTPIHNMVSGLGGHDIIALLLAYWSIYTAIYIVFDIIIVCFVKITHMIQGE